jgi:hypothetical protein
MVTWLDKPTSFAVLLEHTQILLVVATSTCEADFIAASRAVKERLHRHDIGKEAPYFGKLMTDLCGRFRPITVRIDNQTAIVLLCISAAGAQHSTTHLDVC